MPLFLVIYLGQSIHGLFAFAALTGYDAIFIQCIQLMTYRFRIMSNLLKLLCDCEKMPPEEQTEVLIDVCKMHLDTLK